MLDYRRTCLVQAASALIFGVFILLLPGLLLDLLGMTRTPSLDFVARFGGAMLTALGATLFVAREAADRRSRWIVALSNGLVDFALALFFVAEIQAGRMGAVGYGLAAIFALNVLSWFGAMGRRA